MCEDLFEPIFAPDESRVAVDAVYGPEEETRLIRKARERGARLVAGKRMLLYQGVQSWTLWTGREPDVRAMSDVIS